MKQTYGYHGEYTMLVLSIFVMFREKVQVFFYIYYIDIW